jgi:polysaccharide pyruvyl transferase WcaK-like protein
VSGQRGHRAAFLGYQGFGNLGDEAILAGIERVLEPLKLTPAILIGGPAVGTVGAFPGARRISPRRLLPTLDALRALRSCQVLILSGGGLFNDHWATVIPRYLSWVVAARIAGARVAWLGVGVGPIRRRGWRRLARLAARLSEPVFVRDRASAILLGGGPKIRVAPDMAFFNPPPPTRRRDPVLALIVRPPVRSGSEPAASLERTLSAVAACGAAAGLEPRLQLMAPDVDRLFAERVGLRIQAELGVRPRIEVLGRTSPEALERLAACELVASVRLHGLILAAIAGVPCLPIAYDPKITAIAHQLGLDEVVIQPTMWADVDLAFRAVRKPECQVEVSRRVEHLRAGIAEIRDRLGVIA